MVISHTLQTIFIKTKKVSGTSFELAMGHFCGPSCVITPITEAEEAARRQAGLRGAQNFERPFWAATGTQSEVTFYHHAPAEMVRDAIPRSIWDSYRKIAIFRNPFDTAISRYFWMGGHKTGLDLTAFLQANTHFLHDNTKIAPLSGAASMDHYLRYETLQSDLQALGLAPIYKLYAQIKAKAGHRPKTGASMAEMYAANPAARDLVAQECAEEIAFFGYDAPNEDPLAAAS